MPHGDILVAVPTVLLFISTVALVWATVEMGRRQERLQAHIAKSNAEREQQTANETAERERQQAALQRQIANEAAEREHSQRQFEQRAQLIPVWQYISSLSEVDPKEPITPDAVKIANTLELVAVAVEGGVLDRQVVLRVFRGKFIELYEQVRDCGPLPGYREGLTGAKLLEQCNAATELYEELIKERRRADRPEA